MNGFGGYVTGEVNHTPGPWHVDEEGHVSQLGNLNGIPGYSGGRICRVTDPTHWSAKEDARLIAAAPDLLAACLMFDEWEKSNCQDEAKSFANLRDAMTKAIAKAKGGAQ